MIWLFQLAKTGRIKTLGEAMTAFQKINGRPPSLKEMKNMEGVLREAQGKTADVIQFPKDRITDPFKPRPGEASPLFKDSPEAIAKIKAENKAAAERLRKKKDRVATADELEDYINELDPTGETGVVQEGMTIKQLDKMVAEQKAYEAAMYRDYKAGKLDPTPGDKSPARKRFLEKKREEMELSGDKRLMTRDEIEELEAFNLNIEAENKAAAERLKEKKKDWRKDEDWDDKGPWDEPKKDPFKDEDWNDFASGGIAGELHLNRPGYAKGKEVVEEAIIHGPQKSGVQSIDKIIDAIGAGAGISTLGLPKWLLSKLMQGGVKSNLAQKYNQLAKENKLRDARQLLTDQDPYTGRIGKYGGGIGAAMPRIPTGMPRTNAGGITELDYRQEGGFVPMGVKEKADDVPAMLSKNEFVMTADAVKAAGDGSVEKGAQRMYDTMKQLEGRVA